MSPEEDPLAKDAWMLRKFADPQDGVINPVHLLSFAGAVERMAAENPSALAVAIAGPGTRHRERLRELLELQTLVGRLPRDWSDHVEVRRPRALAGRPGNCRPEGAHRALPCRARRGRWPQLMSLPGFLLPLLDIFRRNEIRYGSYKAALLMPFQATPRFYEQLGDVLTDLLLERGERTPRDPALPPSFQRAAAQSWLACFTAVAAFLICDKATPPPEGPARQASARLRERVVEMVKEADSVGFLATLTAASATSPDPDARQALAALRTTMAMLAPPDVNAARARPLGGPPAPEARPAARPPRDRPAPAEPTDLPGELSPHGPRHDNDFVRAPANATCPVLRRGCLTPCYAGQRGGVAGRRTFGGSSWCRPWAKC